MKEEYEKAFDVVENYAIELYNKELELLQELVERATPKKKTFEEKINV